MRHPRTAVAAALLGTAGLAIPGCPAAAVQAAGAPTLTVSAQGQNTPGGTVTLTATATGFPTPPDIAWWVEDPDGTWTAPQGWRPQTTLTLPNLQPGTYLVVAGALTPAQVAAGQWGATVYARYVVNVDTGVRITALTPDPVTPGQPVTVTAEAVNLPHPVFQWWIEENGQWRGTDYAASPTFTFTPTTADVRIAVYAKTPDAPNNAGDPLGPTAAVSLTPADFLPDAALAQRNQQVAQETLQQVVQQTPAPAATNGTITWQVAHAPDPALIAPRIPADFPPDGTITGVTTTWRQMLQDGAPQQGVSGFQPLPDWIPQGVWWDGLEQAAQYDRDVAGNDPLAVLADLAPMDSMSEAIFGGPSNQTVLQAWEQQVAQIYQGSLANNGYAYRTAETVEYQAPGLGLTGQLTLNGAPPSIAPDQNLPPGLLLLSVPVAWRQVAGNLVNGSTQVDLMTGVDLVIEELVQDPAAGGYRWWLVSDRPITHWTVTQVLWP